MTRALAWLGEQNTRRQVAQRLLPAVPLIRAVALALRQVPGLNGTWIDGEFKPGPAVHLGMAISMRGGGLIAPAIRDADTKSVDELMSALRDLVERVRGGRLRSSEMTDATATLTNLGDMGVERVYGIIYPPQVALIGFGKVSMRPWVHEGALVTRQIVTATLAADHRASDGLVGARFLSTLDGLLQAPDQLWSAS
jgi:pyruvate dehydrogenase E2 component (dihydrolipoamide acetyltransferase)